MHPRGRGEVAGVLALLEEDELRNANKTDLNLRGLEQQTIWEVARGRVRVAFIELTDGQIRVLHVALVSGFIPPASSA